jgi:hypothetical protein
MQYSEFADKMIRAVHGKVRYAESAIKELFDDMVSPSQEAFTLLLYRNGYEHWLWKHGETVAPSGTSDVTEGETGSSSDGGPGYQYTNGNRFASGEGMTTRNGGWSRTGMLKYNELYEAVKESRNEDKGAFSKEYKEHWIDKSTRRRKRKRDDNTGGPRVLKISDDLGDLTGGLLLDETVDESEAANDSVVQIAL